MHIYSEISFCRKVDHFTLCCHAEESLPNVICTSLVGNGVSSCEELLKNNLLTHCIWALGVMAFLGNLVVILWRIIGKDINRVNSFLLVGNRCRSNKYSLDPNSAVCSGGLLQFYNRARAGFLIFLILENEHGAITYSFFFSCMFCYLICIINRQDLKIKTVMPNFS